jgi:large subunit ribosomal protein L15
MDTKYFGKNGFHSPQSIHSKENAINLNKLEEIAQGETEINLTEMGYTKLLGTGKIVKALTITVPACSKTAVEKIEAAGGKVVTETEEEEKAEPES